MTRFWNRSNAHFVSAVAAIDSFDISINAFDAYDIYALYIEKITKILPPQTREAVDLDYYLNTFYEFSINKLNYNLNGKFGELNHLIKGYAKPDKSPIIYNKKNMAVIQWMTI